MPILIEYLSVWDISHRWAAYDVDRYRFIFPLAVKDNFRLIMEAILEGELFCETLTLEKRPSDSKADPKYYIRTHIDDVYACIGGQKYNKKLLNWAIISRGDFHEWCERRSIPLPEFWFPKGWKYDFEWPEYGTRASWARHEEPEEQGGFSLRFDIPEMGDAQNIKNLTNQKVSDGELDIDSATNLRPNQLTKLIVQRIALKIWEDPDNKDINISQMARHEVILKYAGVEHYDHGTITKWVREIAPVNLKGKRGRPSDKSDEAGE
ncbi:MAG: hypothetical protein CL578_11280 [Alteromonadaceae bacterium]|jgi:hypothetical protein|uniref:hypothetical protein n=1 Tax=unclassified Methylophaga TaxID=2629249 RepID=UPI000C4ACEFA|nr:MULTISPECIES: hypothetical protein [unclassified Methylophaga]MAP27947.1 hypothetical protein [Methylophaga sp.]MBN25617.1 hypothetical protein [Alteromonadaceae bacterium]HCN99444.1 hypothetical protein [Methylophaga sp.]|tara:strand:+ start:9626 stop:10420 length:795 start_codon:yes stop_codon:yes gene_type:complete